jgi:hypothetical protein
MLLHEVKALTAPGRMYYFVVVFVWIGIYHAETLDRSRRFSRRRLHSQTSAMDGTQSSIEIFSNKCCG